ncbi:MAG: hypothetical protein QNJ94_05365 [Alphaproteobacteria bacterium]|nr:hypothetical protein [Alphaproteobacteria bacterium]
MNEIAPFTDLIDTLCAKGRISEDDVLKLRRSVFPDGVVSGTEADAVFRLDEACADKDAAWTAFYVDALTDYFLWQSEPRGYVDEALARILIAHIGRDGHVHRMSELELLLNIVHWATQVPEELSVLALNAVRDSVLSPETASYGTNRPPAVISPADVAIVRKVIYGTGSLGSIVVTRREAEVILALNDAVRGAENAPDWRDLFVKAMANHLMFPRPVSVPSAEEAARREAWLEDRRGVGRLLMDVGKAFARRDIPFDEAWQEIDPFGREQAREAQAKEDRETREALAREAIDAGEAQWLCERMLRDGAISENERALLQFIRDNAPHIDPALEPALSKAGV